jgi:hypothetical protein
MATKRQYFKYSLLVSSLPGIEETRAFHEKVDKNKRIKDLPVNGIITEQIK